MTSDEMPECPLCMVELFYDDLAFYPCSCGYQICRFCWSKILNEENGLCPACRRAYDSEAPASFTPLSEEQFQKLKREKRHKERKNKTIENRKHLADIRVVQRNLAFVIGLPQRFADHPELLKSPEYFGKYGKVFKVVVNRNAAQPSSQNQSTVGAYVTFVKGEDTIQAIMDLNKQQMEGRTLKASLGTTKYCSQFLKGASCTKGECMYLHELGEQAASFTKEEMQQNKHTEYERKLIDDFIEQSGMSSESNVISSSSQSHTASSQSSSQNQNQSQNRLQHASECRDQSSSSSNSNSNTPPSSRRQTKSESHTQSHRHSQQSQNKQHLSSHRSGASSNSTDTNSSQRTPRKNSQNHKSHGRGQKQHKQRSTQQKQQQQSSHEQQHALPQKPQQQQPPASHEAPQLQPVSSTASVHTQALTSQAPDPTPPSQHAQPEPTNSSSSEPAPAGDPVTDIMPQDGPTASTSYPISSGCLPLPPALMSFDHQAPSNSLPEEDALRPSTPNDMPQSHQMRAHALNGLNTSGVGIPPYPLPQMCSFSLQQFMLDFHRQQLQQAFDSQQQQASLSSASFPADHHSSGGQTESEENRHYQQLSASKWPVTDSLQQETFSPQDDDVANLDFDPVKESQQALAALLEHERNNCAASSSVTSANTTGFMSNNCTQQQQQQQSQLTPPPGFEMPAPFSGGVRPAVLRPPSMNMCHPGMMGYGYYSSGVPPGAVEMGLPNDKANVSMGMAPGADRPQHLPSANSTTGHSTAAPGPPSPGLPFSVKALQDTLRCVLPEETNITFDPSLMREMQFQPFEPHAAAQTNASSASQLPLDAITSANSSRGLDQSLDARANSSAKDSLTPEYCSLWPPTPSRNKENSSAVENDICLHSDAVWSSPTTPPGFGSTVLQSLLGGLSSSNVHGVDGQRSAISVDAQTSVTATGDQQQAMNKL